MRRLNRSSTHELRHALLHTDLPRWPAVLIVIGILGAAYALYAPDPAVAPLVSASCTSAAHDVLASQSQQLWDTLQHLCAGSVH